MKQYSLKESITIQGIGLHSGQASNLTLKPAPADTGIVFRRSDIENAENIPAIYDNVCDTQNCTCLKKGGSIISTIEHLMAALYTAGIDNAYIECCAKEIPILDGSAAVFYDFLSKAPKIELDAPRKILKILKPVYFEDNKKNHIELLPSPHDGLNIHFEIDFPSKVVGHQIFDGVISPQIFMQKIAPCRTFCEKYQIEYLQSLGLIKGGSLENAIVLDGDTILNPDGFRVENECVNHKVLDLIGDMFTSGYFIHGTVNAFKTGHYHNNEILKKLFSDQSNYEIK